MKKYGTYLTISLLFVVFFTACKKDNPTTTSAGTTTGTALDHIKDSVYLFTQEDYLWYDALPTYDVFKPRGFTGTTDVLALQSEVDALSQYKINPATSNPPRPYEYDPNYPGEAKYSFIDGGEVATSLGGTNKDFGFSPAYNTSSDLRVEYVYPGSPADQAGLVRGYQIIKINKNSSLSYDGTNGTNYNFVINAYYNSSTISLTLQKPDNTTFDVTLNAANYTVNPVLKSKVIDLGNGNKMGYVVFNSFTDPTNAKAYLDAAFTSFTAAGITDLVVDLRYNGGGSVSTAEYLSDLIVPYAKTNTLMYTSYFNDKLQNDNYPLLAEKYQINKGDFKPSNNQVNFTKAGSLNINRVFFIVTGSTASASELTINNLIPELNVQLIGTTTYGKPVGFFAIPIGSYQLYTPEFETKNSASQGGYYAGMTPGSATYPGVQASDDVTHDFGDTNEALLARAISYATKGTYTISSALTTLSTGKSGSQLSEDQINRISHDLSKRDVNVMISKKLKNK
ncbi:S41 family peptidase [Mucilaginibacter arboris]|uniref:Tail specific protease domain-containing protein n=1 Tax=Mucilaginibacter arboris TaxID=2682090 RepID=A0A7K1SUB9_9SPHI|nr:S41 family peptidase [Mucilaginibacter arboris]MVN20853.1 hypothetical protein [Mucilaginibacter arboris]